MIWSEGDVCEKLFKLYFGHICGNLCPFSYFISYLIFFDLVCTFDSMIGNDRSLFTFFQYEH